MSVETQIQPKPKTQTTGNRVRSSSSLFTPHRYADSSRNNTGDSSAERHTAFNGKTVFRWERIYASGSNRIRTHCVAIAAAPSSQTSSLHSDNQRGSQPRPEDHRKTTQAILRQLIFATILGGVFFTYDIPSFSSKAFAEDSHDHAAAPPMTKDKLSTQSKNVLTKSEKKAGVYTCPMHPQIRQPSEGRCPICGMELVLADSDDSDDSVDDGSIRISPVARRVAGIKTIMVETKSLNKSIHAIGNIKFDESKLSTIPANIDGRIEKLFANFTGIHVNKFDHLAVMYSPMLYSAQVEFLQAKKSVARMKKGGFSSSLNTQKSLFENSRTKLRELGMTDKQIQKISRTGIAESRLEIYAPIGGTVIEKPASQGQYIKTGQTIFKIADLSTVWLIMDVFPEDASLIRYGQQVSARVRSVPNEKFLGRVAFISPVVNPKTRTVSIRVEMPNPNGNLRPGDYAEAEISVPITTGSKHGKIFDPSLAGKYVCPMHPQVIKDKPGKCPFCGMDLESSEKLGYASADSQQAELLVIPRDAVLTIGKNSVVFVEEEEGRFKIRQVRTGIATRDEVVITEGLEEFDVIAASGVFLLDSQMQLNGKTSLIDIAPNGKTDSQKNSATGQKHNH